jgi:hypothetical protein
MPILSPLGLSTDKPYHCHYSAQPQASQFAGRAADIPRYDWNSLHGIVQ